MTNITHLWDIHCQEEPFLLSLSLCLAVFCISLPTLLFFPFSFSFLVVSGLLVLLWLLPHLPHVFTAIAPLFCAFCFKWILQKTCCIEHAALRANLPESISSMWHQTQLDQIWFNTPTAYLLSAISCHSSHKSNKESSLSQSICCHSS